MYALELFILFSQVPGLQYVNSAVSSRAIHLCNKRTFQIVILRPINIIPYDEVE